MDVRFRFSPFHSWETSGVLWRALVELIRDQDPEFLKAEIPHPEGPSEENHFFDFSEFSIEALKEWQNLMSGVQAKISAENKDDQLEPLFFNQLLLCVGSLQQTLRIEISYRHWILKSKEDSVIGLVPR